MLLLTQFRVARWLSISILLKETCTEKFTKAVPKDTVGVDVTMTLWSFAPQPLQSAYEPCIVKPMRSSKCSTFWANLTVCHAANGLKFIPASHMVDSFKEFLLKSALTNSAALNALKKPSLFFREEHTDCTKLTGYINLGCWTEGAVWHKNCAKPSVITAL